MGVVRICFLWILALTVVGCDQIFPPKKKPQPPMTGESLSNVAAQSVTREISGNQLIIIDVPVSSLGTMKEIQHCFVWRDREFKTASISCPGNTDYEPSSEEQ